MTPEKVIELAKQAEIFKGSYNIFSADECNLQRFAQLVRNETLEEAEKACSYVYYKHIGEGYAEVRYGIAACEKEIQGLKS